MDKQEIIEQANSNIEKLINALVDKEYEAHKLYCVEPEKQRNKTCDEDCDNCQKEFYDNIRKKLRDKYYLKA